MTDDRMDALLREVGSRWREEHPGEVDVPVPAPAPRRGRPRWPLLVSAAAVAAALVVGLVVTIAGLGGDDTKPTPAAGLANTVWRLTDDGRPAASGGTLYVAADGTMVADDACAVVGTKLDAEYGKLYPTGSVPVRRRPCGDQTGPQLGDTFVDLLTEFPGYAVDGDHLTIGTGAGQLRFVADPALPRPTIDVPSISEARWRLTGVRNAAGDELTVPDDVEFRYSNGDLSTSDGCNEISTDTSFVTDTQFDATGVTATERGCVTGGPATTVIDQLLSTKIDQRVTGNTLTLSRPGIGTLTYTWVPDDTTATDPTRLVGPDFRLVGVAGQPADGPYSISFRTNRLSGVDGCGRTRSGTAELARGAFRATSGTANLMGCAKMLSSGQHDAVDRTLFGQAALWTLQDGELVVRGDGPQSSALVFAAGDATAASLQGRWSVLSVDPAAGQGSTFAAVIFDHGRLTVESGCASLSTPFTVRGSDIVLPKAMSVPFCTPAADPATVDVLGQPGRVGFTVAGDELTLTRDRTTLNLKRP